MRFSPVGLSTLLVSAFLLCQTAPVDAKAQDTAGRAGSWKKAAQGSPDLAAAQAKVTANPKDAEALNDLGFALRQNGQLKDAEKYLKQAIEAKPTMGEAHANLSVVYYDQSNWADALSEAQKAVKANADQAIFRCVLANALSKTGDLKGASQEYKMAIQLKPDYQNAYYNLGRVLNELGEVNDAKYSLSKALELDPNDDRVVALLDKLDGAGTGAVSSTSPAVGATSTPAASQAKKVSADKKTATSEK